MLRRGEDSPKSSDPTDPFTISEPQIPLIDEFYLVQKKNIESAPKNL